MRKTLLKAAGVAVVTMALVGCKPTETDAKDFAQRAIAANLIDPKSAEFMNVEFYDRTPADQKENRLTGTVCGQVNAKNRLGGYTGATAFYVEVMLDADQSQVKSIGFEPSGSLKGAFNQKRLELCRRS